MVPAIITATADLRAPTRRAAPWGAVSWRAHRRPAPGTSCVVGGRADGGFRSAELRGRSCPRCPPLLRSRVMTVRGIPGDGSRRRIPRGVAGPRAHGGPLWGRDGTPPSLTECRAIQRAGDLLFRRPSYSSPRDLPVTVPVPSFSRLQALGSTRTGCERTTANLGGVCLPPLRVSSEVYHGSTGVSLITFGIFRA